MWTPEAAGTPPRPWTNKELASEISKRGKTVSESAVSKWRNDANGFSHANFLMLLDLLLPVPEPGCGKPHQDRAAMEAAWADESITNAKRPRRSLAEEPSLAYAADWPRTNPKPIPSLAALELHTPQPGNEGGFYLRGRLDLTVRDDDSAEQPFRLGIRKGQAFITVAVSENFVMDGSLIGKRAPHKHLAPAGDALRVVGPARDDECLEGEVFDDTHLAVVTPTDDGAAEVTVTLSVLRRAFVVTALDEDGAPKAALDSEAKNAVLNALIFGNLPRDDAGRTILQKATLRRRSKA